ncbi:MAG: hypothetical protein US50_C0017G0011 [Candidatus Nomurabacteria bacterium GW2011_GWB1_37_5]|uniref:Uncharacterized protein n=1 Tax=Candidatus Nomurabacteria bacterium GW2011_GWB1_37_5 TaxID=1618742 RepID=A0A0G0H9Y8_9BACT|nr:MAG: hypothetical protein US50_C0017G0011 [Candidatus Nomurabacteria bacterium GW2011_GWB1_37_5]
MTTQRGGKREGAGRKKGFPALQHEEARKLLSIKLATEFGPIVDKAIEQAKDGDTEARRWLTDRAWGRAKESVDMNVQPVFSLKALALEADRLEREGKLPPLTPLEDMIEYGK